MSGQVALATDQGQAAPPGEPGESRALTPPQKAAIIISALPPDDAGNLLQKLGQTHIRAYVAATRQLRHVPLVILEKVVIEFLESLENNDIIIGPETAENVLSRIMSAEAVSEMIGELGGTQRSVWDRLQDVSSDSIALYIQREHPRAAAIIMSRLLPEKAATVIDLLDADAAEQVVDVLKTPTDIRPQVLATVEESIRIELLTGASKKVDTPDVFIGAVFDNLTEQTRDPLMKSLSDKTPEFASAVAKHMFLFDDIPARLGEKDVPSLTTAVDQAVLATGLAYAASRGSEASEFILTYLPKRMAEQIREAMEEAGEIDQQEGEKAEAEVIKNIRRMASAGDITLVST